MADTWQTPEVTRGVYWIGQDGNVWVKGDQGTNMAGAADANTNTYWQSRGFGLIDDPLANDYASTRGATTNGPSYDALQAYREAYANKRGTIQSYIDMLPGEQAGAISGLEKNYGFAANQLATSKAQGLNKVDYARGENESNKISSFNDINKGIRNSIDAFKRRVGTLGAGDSSAARVLAPYAFANLQAQQRGDVLKTFNKNANDLSMQATDIENQFNSQKQVIDQDFTTKRDSIIAEYTKMRQQLQEQLQSANDEERMWLAQAGQALTQNTIASIAQVTADWKNQTGALTAQADQWKANYQPIVDPNIQMSSFRQYGSTYSPNIGNGATQASDALSYNPYQKKENQLY